MELLFSVFFFVGGGFMLGQWHIHVMQQQCVRTWHSKFYYSTVRQLFKTDFHVISTKNTVTSNSPRITAPTYNMSNKN